MPLNRIKHLFLRTLFQWMYAEGGVPSSLLIFQDSSSVNL